MITSLTIRVDTEYSITFKESIKTALFLALWHSCLVTANGPLWLQMTSTKRSAKSKDYHPLILLWERHKKLSIGWQREHGMRHIRNRNDEEEPWTERQWKKRPGKQQVKGSMVPGRGPVPPHLSQTCKHFHLWPGANTIPTLHRVCKRTNKLQAASADNSGDLFTDRPKSIDPRLGEDSSYFSVPTKQKRQLPKRLTYLIIPPLLLSFLFLHPPVPYYISWNITSKYSTFAPIIVSEKPKLKRVW